MPTIPINVLQQQIPMEDLQEEFAKLQKLLRYLLNGQIDFENIRARSIKTENLEAGSVTTNELAAGSVKAGNIDVDELSAISANLGKVIAGILVGAYISTADGTYPRIDFSSVGNLLAAYKDETHSIGISPDLTSTPTITFHDGDALNPDAIMSYIANIGIMLQTFVGSVTINSAGNIFLYPALGSRVFVPGWSSIFGESNLQNLQQALDEKVTGNGTTTSFAVIDSINIDFANETYSTTSKTVTVANSGIISVV